MYLLREKGFNFLKRNLLIFVALLFSVVNSFGQSYNYEKATEAFKAKDYDLALDFYTREISDNPKNIEALFYRAIVYQYKDKNSLAISDLKKFKELRSSQMFMQSSYVLTMPVWPSSWILNR